MKFYVLRSGTLELFIREYQVVKIFPHSHDLPHHIMMSHES